MKGLLTKDFLTVKKKYGIARLIMDLAIIAALMIILEGAGSIYISFLLVPLEVASMLITLANSDEQWKWGKYAVALPIYNIRPDIDEYITILASYLTILSYGYNVGEKLE